MRNGTWYIALYILMWICLYYYNKRHRRYFDGTSLIIMLNIVYAICSIVIYNDPIISNDAFYTDATFGPFIYLFVAQLIVMVPLLKNENKILTITRPSLYLLKWFAYVYIILAVLQIPFIYQDIRDGLYILLSSENGGSYLYNNRMNTTNGVGYLFYYMFTDIAILVFFYMSSVGIINKFLKYGIIMAVSLSLIRPISMGLRTETVMRLLSILVSYFIFNRFIPNKLNNVLKKQGLIVLGVVLTLFFILTASRAKTSVGSYIMEYAGQGNLYFNSYGLDAGGLRNGDRTAWLFKRYLGYDVAKELQETREKYSHMKLDDGHFSTYVGDFTLDYGPIWTLIIFSLFSIIMLKIINIKNGKIYFHQLLCMYFIMCICIQGGFYLFSYSYGGNYVIIAFVFMYLLFLFDSKSLIKQNNKNAFY